MHLVIVFYTSDCVIRGVPAIILCWLKIEWLDPIDTNSLPSFSSQSGNTCMFLSKYEFKSYICCFENGKTSAEFFLYSLAALRIDPEPKESENS